MHKTLKEENEAIIKLKGMCPDNKIPKGLLRKGQEAINDAVEAYELALEMDEENEKRPLNETKTGRFLLF
jgi:serine/threonine-protein phosphatase 2B catalytic subunit